jgi:hypothetical protein
MPLIGVVIYFYTAVPTVSILIKWYFHKQQQIEVGHFNPVRAKVTGTVLVFGREAYLHDWLSHVKLVEKLIFTEY